MASFVNNHTSVTPRRLLPTTAIPMTAPPLKAARKEGLIPDFAASADLIFAIVAISMPILPAMAEKIVPQMYETAIKRFFDISAFSLQIGAGRNIKIITAATPTNFARVVYSFFKKVFAPFLISLPTSAIRSLEDGRFLTQL